MKIIHATQEELIKDGKNYRDVSDYYGHIFDIDSINSCYECDEHCVHRTYILCQKCQKRTCYGSYIDIDGEIHSYFCDNCNVYYSICSKCVEPEDGSLMRLISHANKDFSETHADADYKIVKCSSSDYEDGDESRIIYIKPVYFYNEAKFGWITGPDGGYTSTWFCENCNFETEMNDKF